MSRSDPMERRRQAKQMQDTGSPDSSRDSLVSAFQGVTEGAFDLFSSKLTLARHELVRDLKEAGGSAGLALAGGVVVLWGYLLLNVAAVLLVGAFWKGLLGMGVGALVLATINLIGGGLLLRSKVKSLSQTPGLMEKTRDELKKDQAWLQEINNKPRLNAPNEP